MEGMQKIVELGRAGLDAQMTQQARNLLMELDDRQQRPLFLIHDRDKKLSRAFDGIFQSEGITSSRRPSYVPGAVDTSSCGASCIACGRVMEAEAVTESPASLARRSTSSDSGQVIDAA